MYVTNIVHYIYFINLLFLKTRQQQKNVLLVINIICVFYDSELETFVVDTQSP